MPDQFYRVFTCNQSQTTHLARCSYVTCRLQY